MSRLTELARGKECMVRMPSICNFNPETTILAHIRMAGLTGGAQKAPDQLGAWCCSSCHDEADRRTRKLGKSVAELCFYEGIFRTQYELIKKGLIK